MPWEAYFSSTLNARGTYWLITKGGLIPGYVATMLMIPQLKFGLVTLQTGGSLFSIIAPAVSLLLPAFEETLTRYALPPPRPNNITQFEGLYVAEYLLGLVSANVTIEVVGSTLNVTFQAGGGIAAGEMVMNATWVGGNTFRLHIEKDLPCLDVQSGWNDLFLYFHISTWSGEIFSLTMPGTATNTTQHNTHLV